MANVYGTAVVFSKELNVWTLEALVQFGPSGASTLNTNQSKGFCSVAPDTITLTGGTLNSSTTFGSVSSFDGIFRGMTITGPAGELQANTTISSMTAATKTLILSIQAIATNTGATYQISGGRYRFQLGTQAALRLTPFVKLLGVQVSWDVSTGSAGGNATQLQLAPSAPEAFVIDNQVSVRTIPATSTSGSTDATVTLQFGFGQGPGTGFQAVVPADGEQARVVFILGNSTGV